MMPPSPDGYAVDLNRLHEHRHGDCRPHQAGQADVWRRARSQVQQPVVVDVPHVGVEGNGEVAGYHPTQPVMVELFQGFHLDHPGEAASQGEGNLQELAPFRVDVICAAPAEHEFERFLGAQTGGDGRQEHGGAGAGRDGGDLQSGFLEGSHRAQRRDHRPAAAGGDQSDLLAFQRLDRERPEGRKELGIERRVPVDVGDGQEGFAQRVQKREILLKVAAERHRLGNPVEIPLDLKWTGDFAQHNQAPRSLIHHTTSGLLPGSGPWASRRVFRRRGRRRRTSRGRQHRWPPRPGGIPARRCSLATAGSR